MLLNATAVPSQPAGAGVYTIELGRALAARDDIALTAVAPRDLIEDATFLPSPASGGLRRTIWERAFLPRIAHEQDVYHGAHFYTPPRLPCPAVATVHDLTFFRLPRRYDRRRRTYYRWIARSARRAARIIVPSKAVAGDVIHYLEFPPEDIRVIAEAPRAGLTPAREVEVGTLCLKYGLERPYLLCVGTAEPGKRAVDAVRAVATLKERGISVQLALAGNEGPLSAALRAEAARLEVADRVRFLGYVPDGDMAALYTGALALVFPSLWEGFGLPPLEAMACGTPVIASRAPAMIEVLGDAAVFIPLRDPMAIADQAARFIGEPEVAADWGARGQVHAASFSWTVAAAATADVYREVALR